MSGGYIDDQKPGGHQVVIFTFSGEITRAQSDEWNFAIQRLKFEVFTPETLTGVTMRGQKSKKIPTKRSQKKR